MLASRLWRESYRNLRVDPCRRCLVQANVRRVIIEISYSDGKRRGRERRRGVVGLGGRRALGPRSQSAASPFALQHRDIHFSPPPIAYSPLHSTMSYLMRTLRNLRSIGFKVFHSHQPPDRDLQLMLSRNTATKCRYVHLDLRLQLLHPLTTVRTNSISVRHKLREMYERREHRAERVQAIRNGVHCEGWTPLATSTTRTSRKSCRVCCILGWSRRCGEANGKAVRTRWVDYKNHEFDP